MQIIADCTEINKIYINDLKQKTLAVKNLNPFIKLIKFKKSKITI